MPFLTQMDLKDITTLEPHRKYYILFDLYATLKNIALPWDQFIQSSFHNDKDNKAILLFCKIPRGLGPHSTHICMYNKLPVVRKWHLQYTFVLKKLKF